MLGPILDRMTTLEELLGSTEALSLQDSPGNPSDYIPYLRVVSESGDFVSTSFQTDSMIRDSMNLHNITVSTNDPDYLKVFVLQAEALFQCTGIYKTPDDEKWCEHKWTCYNATIVIDLVEQVSKRYRQWCMRCFKQWGVPHFTNKQFAQIVKRVITCYERRKKAGGTVPSVEYNGSHSPKAFEPHEEVHCGRCKNLQEPCWLYLVPYCKKIPLSMISFVRSSLVEIDAPLNKIYAKASVLATTASSKVGRIRINPLSGSENIKQWRKQCETILESFLKNLSSISLPLEPKLLPKLQGGVEPNSSLLIEEKTVLEIAGDAKEVSELIEKVQHIEKMVKEKRKPCIILW